jgi:hypothetical protein
MYLSKGLSVGLDVVSTPQGESNRLRVLVAAINVKALEKTVNHNLRCRTRPWLLV